tara:strand:+ start:622 stop:1875 length:1254 start_codon:yes stop_codon:yes gene_type:complete
MGLIRDAQTDYLRQGKEQINFKRFSYDGTYLETVDEDVLINCPKDLIPLDRNLTKLYEKPLKEVHFVSEPLANFYINQNAQFLNGSTSWIISTPPVTTSNAIVDDTPTLGEAPKALSGNKYFRTTNYQNNTEDMLLTDHQTLKVSTNQALKVEFDVYFDSTDLDSLWFAKYRLNVQESYNSNYPTGGKTFKFTTNEWLSSFSSNTGRTTGMKPNVWHKVSLTIPPYIPTSDAITEVFTSFTLIYPWYTTTGSSAPSAVSYFDNVRVSETIQFDGGISSIRKQYDYTNGLTGIYKSEGNIFSNEAGSVEKYIGKFTGGFKRSRDTVTKTVEQLVTQEILNDNRDYLTKYEGTFKNRSDYNITPHKKIWVDFGEDLLEEPVSCYVDSIKFDVKAAIYDIQMHVPNQDDDIDSTYEVIIE